MTQIRTLFAAWIAATAVVLALASSASADYISTYPLSFYESGTGQWDGFRSATNGGASFGIKGPAYSNGSDGFGEAGVTLAIYGTDGATTTAATYGFHGSYPLINGTPPFKTTVGSETHLQSEYLAGNYNAAGACVGDPCLRVTEIAAYNPASNTDIYFTYYVTNDGSVPVKYRLTMAADPDLYSAGDGRGYLDGSPRRVGVDNPYRGDYFEFQEVGASPWSRYQASAPFAIWQGIKKPLNSDGSVSNGLSNGVTSSTTTDKAVAIQWDNHVSSALAAGAQDTYQVFARWGDYDTVALSDPGYKVTGANAPATTTATVKDRHGTAVALQSSDVHYQIDYGPDENTGRGWQTQGPQSVGSNKADVTINWGGDGTTTAASDEVKVWVDLNHDGIQDSDEPVDYRYVNWYDAFQPYPDYSNGQINLDSINLNVTSRDPVSHAQVYRAFKWKVEGANPQVNGADPDGLNTCDATCAHNPIPLLNDHTGYDTVTVWSDTSSPADGDYLDFGEKRTFKVRWYSGLSIYPAASTYQTTYGTISAQLYLMTDSYADWTSQDIDYVVTGANAQAAGSCADPAVDEDVVNTTACKVTTDDLGDATINISTATPGDVHLVAWVEQDGVTDSLNPGPTANDQIVQSADYTVYVSQDARLTNDAGADGVLNATQGTPVNLGVHSVTSAGANDTTHKLRYSVDQGSLDSTNDREKELTPNGSGNFTIPLAGGGGKLGQDYVYMYVDVNGDGLRESNEPYDYVTVRWNKRAQISPGNAYAFQGNGYSVYARLQHADGSAYTGTFHWSVDGGTQQSGTASNYEYTNASFTVPSTVGLGAHTITISFDDGGTFSDSIVVTWKPRYTITLTPDKTDLSTGAQATMGISVKDNATSSAAPAGLQIHYEIDGYNPDSGTEAVQLDSQGKASVSWIGKKAGSDYVYAWPDLNSDGNQDNDESPMEASKSVTFHNRVDVTGTFGGKNEGNTQIVTVKFRDDAYQPLVNKTLAWQVTGANPQTGAVTTDANGNATFNWTGAEAGNDSVVVWQDSNADGSVDASEQASVAKNVVWYQRVNAYATTCCTKPTNSAYTINVNLENLDGNYQAGAVLHWVGTGPNSTSGDTAATDSSGNTSFQINSQNGGTENVVVFLDSNGNGQRDAGEPQDTLSVTWTSTVTITCSCTNPRPEGNTQNITASTTSPGTLHYQVYGTHPQAAAPYSTQITLNGSSFGADSVVVWVETDNDNVQDPGEPASWFTMYWTPRLQLTGADGTRVAGGSASVTVQRLTATGTVDSTSGVAVNYTVSGPNGPKSGTVHTNSLGKATVTYTSDLQGTDTVSVTDGTFSNSKNVYWSAPPVSLSLSHNSAASALQSNTHTVTATILGVSIPPAGYPVHFDVSGANTDGGTVQSDSSGTAQFTWTGHNDGVDTLTAYGDISGGTGQDGYDPSSSTTMTWQPLVTLSSATADQAIGEPHTETIHFVDGTGAPLANADVWYQITGANPTAGTQTARALTSNTGSRIQARTSATGDVPITWTGTNSGTDTLNAWGDINNNSLLEPGTDAHASKVVTWRAASATSTPPGSTGTPIATTSAVVPGSPQDFDGLPTPPAPVVAKSVNVAPVKGHVFVKLPGKNKFIELLDAEQIPVGSIVDVRKGTVALTSAQNLKGGVATAEFYAGEFQIAQKKAAKPVTDLVLYGGNFAVCGKTSKKSSASTSQKKKIRELWGSGKGSFRTKGKYTSAAIRGTKWDVIDYCDGTLVKVAQGIVTVEPNKGKSRPLKAPKSLFVPPAGLAKKK